MDVELNRRYDIAIAGGGLVGASLASALSGHGLEILVLEAHPPRAPGQPSYDDRTLALSHASCRIFEAIGLWPGVRDGVTPIHQVHISAEGRFGTVRIRAEDFDLEALGHVVEARLVGQAVVERLPQCDDVQVLCPARLESFNREVDEVRLRIEHQGQSHEITTDILVGADGAESMVRRRLGLEATVRDYGQTAIIANVTPETAHRNRAFERLTDSGPVALLPHQARRCGMVWSVPSEAAESLLGLDDEAFLEAFQQRAGYRLGRLQKIGKRASYPLRLVYAPQTVAGRCVILGNAAHAIHPVAAQGFNLGLRDVATLAEVLVRGRSNGQDIPDLLLDYQQRRQPDQARMIRFTDTLIDAFSIRLPLLSALPSAAMVAIDRIPSLKRALARRTMGYGVAAPALARGEAL